MIIMWNYIKSHHGIFLAPFIDDRCRDDDLDSYVERKTLAKIPTCPQCKNFIGFSVDFPGVYICKAFPDGIPTEVLAGEHDHSKPHPAQKPGIFFTPRDNAE
ncbi:MAG: hypothetical protein GTO00_04575 [Deltaproteobacteria bacterium]|nr:hypothetical protein [Deltaproteobacteria bacterium]